MGFWKKLFGDDEDERTVSSETNPIIQTPREEENKVVTLDEVGTFVAEIQSYYVNDNFKYQTEYISNSQSETKARFLEKKMYFEKLAENRITSILAEIRTIEASTRDIWGKSIYSFYEELEKNKLESVYNQVFSLILSLRAVNVKKELDPIIISRIEKYRDSWNISPSVEIPESSSINIISLDEQKEIYQIGTHIVEIKNQNIKRKLSETECNQIANMEIELNFTNPSEFIMIRFASVSRKQISRLYKTAILEDCCMFYENPKIEFFVIKKNELNNFIKSILQITLAFNQYCVITAMNSNADVLDILKDSTIQNNQKREIKKTFQFIWSERSNKYKDNYKVAYIKRKYIPKKLIFENFNELRSKFF